MTFQVIKNEKMTDQNDIHFKELLFYGKITAGISHEIKNGLAIIKETNGLVADFIKMAQRGAPLNLEKIESQLKKVNDRIDN